MSNRLSCRKLALATLPALVALLCATPVRAEENLLTNPDFESNIDGWSVEPDPGGGTAVWVANDPDQRSGVGGLRMISRRDDETFVWAFQCVAATPGARYRFGASLRNFAPHEPQAASTFALRFFSSSDCTPGTTLETFDTPVIESQDVWVSGESGPVTAPPGSRSAALRFGARRASAGDDNALADFSRPFLEALDGGAGRQPNDEGWFTDPAFPDFRFNVEISASADATPLLGTAEAVCVPETVCVSGAVPGRTELFVRIVGPKPNGYLWPTLLKASTSRFDVWIEQFSTGARKHYVLDGASPGSSDLPGLFDRTGFQP